MPFRQRVARHFGDTVSMDFNSSSAGAGREGEGSIAERSASPSSGQDEQLEGQECLQVQASEANGVSSTVAATETPSVPGGTETDTDDGDRRSNAETLELELSRLTLNQLSPKAQYLSYYDILLTGDDIRALRNDDWLTDNNIAFWEEWLEREILPAYPEARIVLLRPTMTFLLMQTKDLKSIVSALPDFRKVTHIFLPVNDAQKAQQADSGSHWSLLLVSVIDRVAFHYDSMGGHNFTEARHCADRLGLVLGVPLLFHQMEDCPQQENNSDCGVYVCILMRHLLIKRLLNANANQKVDMSMGGKMVDAHGARKEMLKIIESMRKEGLRRRSASPYASANTPPRISE